MLKYYKNAINFSLYNDESGAELLTNELCTEFLKENESLDLNTVFFLCFWFVVVYFMLN